MDNPRTSGLEVLLCQIKQDLWPGSAISWLLVTNTNRKLTISRNISVRPYFSTQKFKDIVKILAFSNKNGFDGFINGSITTLTTAAILYSQYMFVQEKQAK